MSAIRSLFFAFLAIFYILLGQAAAANQISQANDTIQSNGGKIKVIRTTNNGVILSKPRVQDNPNDFLVSIINSTGTWYVLTINPESTISSKDVPIVFILGPYQTKEFYANLAIGQKLGWYAISPLGSYYAYQNNPYPASRETAIAAFCLFAIDVVARGIFTVPLPPDNIFDVNTFLNTVDDIIAVLGAPTLDFIAEISNQSVTGNTNFFAPAIWKYINSLKTVSKVTGPSLYSVISTIFNKKTASFIMDKLGGINTILEIADVTEKFFLLQDARKQVLTSPSDDYIEVSVNSGLTATLTSNNYPNPVWKDLFKDLLMCSSFKSPSWYFQSQVKETAGIGVTIDSIIIDYYDKDGIHINTLTQYKNDFSTYFNNCGTNSNYIPPWGTACSNLCVSLGGANSGSVSITYKGIDDNGNNIKTSIREILMGY